MKYGPADILLHQYFNSWYLSCCLKKSLKWYCTSEKAYNFIFPTENSSKNITFKKNPQVEITSREKVTPVFVFHFNVIFSKISKLEQFFCLTLYYTK